MSKNNQQNSQPSMSMDSTAANQPTMDQIYSTNYGSNILMKNKIYVPVLKMKAIFVFSLFLNSIVKQLFT